jgi:arylsulfatase A-like enzyme
MLKRLLASRWFYVLSAGAMIIAMLATQIEIRSPSRPVGTRDDIEQLSEREDLNILFILIDTLRADRLSTYGYERETSPALDALASTGIRFDRHMSQSSWTKCSMASMWTGTYPIRTGVLRSPDAVSSEAVMPAEILHDAGFKTYAIWRNAWIGPDFGFSQGFDVYHSPQARQVPRTVQRTKPTVGVVGTDLDTILSASEFIRTHGDERFFLYLHLMDVHQYVYDEDSALFGSSYSDIYDNSIRWVDKVLSSLIADLDKRGLRDNTIIVIAGDHGEAFGEHGREGHARDVYGEVVTTPFIISLPFRLEEGIVVGTPTENVDVWPTLLELLKLPQLPNADGRSRLPEILAEPSQEPDADASGPRFAHIDQSWGRTKQKPFPMVAVTDGPYRLVYRPEAKGAQHAELYDTSIDRYEGHRIGKEQPEVLERMKGLAQQYLDSQPQDWGGAPEVEIDEAQLQQLRALGYDIQ